MKKTTVLPILFTMLFVVTTKPGDHTPTELAIIKKNKPHSRNKNDFTQKSHTLDAKSEITKTKKPKKEEMFPDLADRGKAYLAYKRAEELRKKKSEITNTKQKKKKGSLPN